MPKADVNQDQFLHRMLSLLFFLSLLDHIYEAPIFPSILNLNPAAYQGVEVSARGSRNGSHRPDT
jgi:hypothetical protein